MKREILKTRGDVMAEVTQSFTGGQKLAAQYLRIEYKRLLNQISEANGVVPLSDEQICILEEINGTNHLPDYICAMYGGYFVKVEDAEDLTNYDLFELEMQAKAKNAERISATSKALIDGKITAKEAKVLLNKFRSETASAERVLRAIIKVHSEK